MNKFKSGMAKTGRFLQQNLEKTGWLDYASQFNAALKIAKSILRKFDGCAKQWCMFFAECDPSKLDGTGHETKNLCGLRRANEHRTEKRRQRI
jgi:hypothetical protein